MVCVLFCGYRKGRFHYRIANIFIIFLLFWIYSSTYFSTAHPIIFFRHFLIFLQHVKLFFHNIFSMCFSILFLVFVGFFFNNCFSNCFSNFWSTIFFEGRYHLKLHNYLGNINSMKTKLTANSEHRSMKLT